jgi:aminodeoxyfutalosine synthase
MVTMNITDKRNEQISQIVAAEPDANLRKIGEKVLDSERIHFDEGLRLFEQAELSYTGALANHVRERLHGDKTYF